MVIRAKNGNRSRNGNRSKNLISEKKLEIGAKIGNRSKNWKLEQKFEIGALFWILKKLLNLKKNHKLIKRFITVKCKELYLLHFFHLLHFFSYTFFCRRWQHWCGASDLKDGLTEFNETFTQCVIDTWNDAHLFRNRKF